MVRESSVRPGLSSPLLSLLLVLLLGACAEEADTQAGAIADDASPEHDTPQVSEVPLEWRPEAEDFRCLTEWTAVRGFHLTNLFGRTDEAVEAAEGDFAVPVPPGTVVQLIPQEAMVKLAPGTSPQTQDWEFLLLDINREGTTIVDRGFTEVANEAGTCFSCHVGAPDRDLICEQTGLCADAAVPPSVVNVLVNGDRRCR